MPKLLEQLQIARIFRSRTIEIFGTLPTRWTISKTKFVWRAKLSARMDLLTATLPHLQFTTQPILPLEVLSNECARIGNGIRLFPFGEHSRRNSATETQNLSQ